MSVLVVSTLAARALERWVCDGVVGLLWVIFSFTLQSAVQSLTFVSLS